MGRDVPEHFSKRVHRLVQLFFTILMFIGCFSVSTLVMATDMPARGGYGSSLSGWDLPTEADAMKGEQRVYVGCTTDYSRGYPMGLTVCYDPYELVSATPWIVIGTWAWDRVVQTRLPRRISTDGINYSTDYYYNTSRLVLRYFCYPIPYQDNYRMVEDPATWQPGTGWPTCTDGLPGGSPPPGGPPSSCQSNHSIRLQGPGGTAGALADVEPGVSVNTLSARVTCDGQPVSGKAVALNIDVVALSGGHQHDQGRRPQHSGTVSFNGSDTTDANGNVAFTFTAPAPAGGHTITAQCGDGSCGTDTGSVWVGVKNLAPLSGLNGAYRLVGDLPEHPDNHYLSGQASQVILSIASEYQILVQYDVPPIPVLHLNDASLERGGIFDINLTWARPHAEHCRGTVIDVRANDAPGAIPEEYRSEFELIARFYGADPMWEVPKDSNKKPLLGLRHYHVRLLGKDPKNGGLLCPW